MFHYNEKGLIELSVPCNKISFLLSSEDTSLSPRKQKFCLCLRHWVAMNFHFVIILKHCFQE